MRSRLHIPHTNNIHRFEHYPLSVPTAFIFILSQQTHTHFWALSPVHSYCIHLYTLAANTYTLLSTVPRPLLLHSSLYSHSKHIHTFEHCPQSTRTAFIFILSQQPYTHFWALSTVHSYCIHLYTLTANTYTLLSTVHSAPLLHFSYTTTPTTYTSLSTIPSPSLLHVCWYFHTNHIHLSTIHKLEHYPQSTPTVVFVYTKHQPYTQVSNDTVYRTVSVSPTTK